MKHDGEFFGRPFIQQNATEKEGHIVYTIKKKDFTLDYRFNKDTSEELKKVLKLDTGRNIFSLGRRSARLWYSMIVLAAEQGRGNSGKFKISDIVRLWECERSGRLYEDIKQTFMSLASFNPHYSNNLTGAKRVEWGHSFFDAWVIRGIGDSAVFEFELNKAALGITHEWLNNDLSLSSLKSGYLAFEVSELKRERKDPKYENFIERLRLLKPGVCKIKFITILEDWIKVRDDFLRKRGACHDLVIKYLEDARGEGELKDFKIRFDTLSKWKENWTVTIRK